MSILETLVATFEPWATLYGGSTTLSVGFTGAHLGALMVGGGLAIAADRTVLRTAGSVDAPARVAIADAVADVHRPVIIALCVSAISGLAQLAADLEALAGNKVLWVKFGLLFLLFGNGLLMLRDERAVRRLSADAAPFGALRLRAWTSLVLWFLIMLAGVGLMQG
jgi:hypothetical protein